MGKQSRSGSASGGRRLRLRPKVNDLPAFADSPNYIARPVQRKRKNFVNGTKGRSREILSDVTGDVAFAELLVTHCTSLPAAAPGVTVRAGSNHKRTRVLPRPPCSRARGLLWFSAVLRVSVRRGRASPVNYRSTNASRRATARNNTRKGSRRRREAGFSRSRPTSRFHNTVGGRYSCHGDSFNDSDSRDSTKERNEPASATALSAAASPARDRERDRNGKKKRPGRRETRETIDCFCRSLVNYRSSYERNTIRRPDADKKRNCATQRYEKKSAPDRDDALLHRQ